MDGGRSNILDLRDALHANPEEVVDLYQGAFLEVVGPRGRRAGNVFIDF